MSISERIFELLERRGMSQKEFSEKTGIAQSVISDWKRKKYNPASEKILIICEVLGVTPEELLSGSSYSNGRSRKQEYILVGKDTEVGVIVEKYERLTPEMRGRLSGYLDALSELEGD